MDERAVEATCYSPLTVSSRSPATYRITSLASMTSDAALSAIRSRIQIFKSLFNRLQHCRATLIDLVRVKAIIVVQLKSLVRKITKYSAGCYENWMCDCASGCPYLG